jgi:hypothetical protein
MVAKLAPENCRFRHQFSRIYLGRIVDRGPEEQTVRPPFTVRTNQYADCIAAVRQRHEKDGALRRENYLLHGKFLPASR